MYRLFKFRSQINNGFPQIVFIDKSHFMKIVKYSNIPGKVYLIFTDRIG